MHGGHGDGGHDAGTARNTARRRSTATARPRGAEMASPGTGQQRNWSLKDEIVGHRPPGQHGRRPDAAGRAGPRRHDFTTLTEKVCGHRAERKTPAAWYVAIAFTAGLTGILFAMIGYLIITGVGVWGLNNPVGWGWAIVNFVFWVGIGHAGHADLGHPLPAAAEVAHQHQPLRRGHDHLRGDLRRHLPGHPRRPHLGGVLAVPDPELPGHVAQLPQPAAVGRVRRRHLRHGLAAVLVHGHGAGPGDPARPGHRAGCGRSSTASSPSAGAAATATGTATRRPT